ncbi:PH domain-containing protein [Virgibacillus senegalensis]|uniref:PH domain-containing protein n=1 Tax=Virgibacillus senegalensis TaxID=1499679 RepID=UPI00069E1E64|nr:PH domain-containing protein [Virgibacillus senegalensis]
MISEMKRMHPAAIIFNFISLLKDVLIPMVIGSFALIRNIDAASWIWALVGLALLLVMIGSGFLSWYRFTYRVEEEELRIESGILIRKKRYISRSRIQSIDLTAGVIHRIFGLVKVEVQTAGSDHAAEAGLKAVSRHDGELLREALKGVKADYGDDQQENSDEESITKRTIKFPRLLLAATTSGGIGIFLSLFAIFGSQVNQLIPEDFIMELYNWAIHLSIVIMLIFLLLICLGLWLMAIAGTILRYSFFTIRKYGNDLFITRGLLEKKQVTIPLNRIQGIRIQENVFRQPLGYAAVYAEVAGGGLDKNDGFSIALFPLLKRSEIPAFIQEYVPGFQLDNHWNVLPKRSLHRFILRSTVPVVVAAVPLVYFFPFYSWMALAVAAAFAGLGYLRYKDAGYQIRGKQLSFRSRTLSRETIMVDKKRIQSLSASDHWFQRRKSLRTVYFSIASHSGVGKSFLVKDMADKDAEVIRDWYSFRTR